MTIANVNLNNTFDDWRKTTNQLIVFAYQTSDRINVSYEMANTAANSVNTSIATAANIAANITVSNTIIRNDINTAANIAASEWVANAFLTNTAVLNIIGATANEIASIAVSNISIMTASNTTPFAPTSGQLWWNTDIARLLMFYNDGTSSQWLDINPVVDISVALDTANAAFAQANSITKIAIGDENTANSTYYVTFSANSNGTPGAMNVSPSKLTFNPSTGTLSSVTFNSLSDISVKDNIVKITDALNIVDQMNGVGFTWKDSGRPSFGIIAQELEKIAPALVDNVGDMKTVNYDGIIAFLIEAIKELNKKLESKG